MTVTPNIEQEKEPEKKKEVPRGAGKTDDLFSAHDFDIKIDLEVPLPSMYLYSVLTHRTTSHKWRGCIPLFPSCLYARVYYMVSTTNTAEMN
jgi:hypothetical protein